MNSLIMGVILILIICSLICSDESNTFEYRFIESKPDVEELEMLLEAYFAQINGILQRLSSVCISLDIIKVKYFY